MEIRDYNEIELQNIKDSYHVNAILNNRDIEKLLDACDDYRYKNDKLDKSLGLLIDNILSEDSVTKLFDTILELKSVKRNKDLEQDILEMQGDILNFLYACSRYIDIVEGRN